MSKKSIYECDEQADTAIRTMVAAIVGGAVVPVNFNWELAAIIQEHLEKNYGTH